MSPLRSIFLKTNSFSLKRSVLIFCMQNFISFNILFKKQTNTRHIECLESLFFAISLYKISVLCLFLGRNFDNVCGNKSAPPNPRQVYRFFCTAKLNQRMISFFLHRQIKFTSKSTRIIRSNKRNCNKMCETSNRHFHHFFPFTLFPFLTILY